MWKVSKYGVFSDPYFPAFGLNTDQKKLRIWTLFTQLIIISNQMKYYLPRNGGIFSADTLWLLHASLSATYDSLLLNQELKVANAWDVNAWCIMVKYYCLKWLV